MAGYRVEFDWDQRKEASNRAKHGLPFELAVTVFRDPFAATILDDGQGSDEERWITVGEAADASSCDRGHDERGDVLVAEQRAGRQGNPAQGVA